MKKIATFLAIWVTILLISGQFHLNKVLDIPEMFLEIFSFINLTIVYFGTNPTKYDDKNFWIRF